MNAEMKGKGLAAERLMRLPPYLFAEIDRRALSPNELLADLGLGATQRLGDLGEASRELRVVALGRQRLGPVHGQVEVAAAVVELVDLA